MEKVLYVTARKADFRAPLFTATGYGTVERKDGKVAVDVKSGKIPVSRTVELK